MRDLFRCVQDGCRRRLPRRPGAIVAIGFLVVIGAAHLAARGDEPSEIAQVRTIGTMGKELKVLEPGVEATLFDHETTTPGYLTHMWFGGSWPGYGRTRLRVYVDGEEAPSIDMELALGHGIGFEDDHAPWGTERMGCTGYPSGIYDTYRVPYSKRIRVTAQLGEGIDERPEFWWIIRGLEGAPLSIGGLPLPATARLKLVRLENHAARRLDEFDLCEVRGAGLLYQVTIAAKSSNFSYLESCIRSYIDGAKTPLFLSSGLEDYFLGTYYFNRGRYANALAGLTHFNEADHSFSAYRFHDADPIVFNDGLRLTCRCGEEIEGKIFHDPQPTTYTTYTWLYQW